MTDPLMNIHDPISAGIRDREGYQKVLDAPCKDRAWMMDYFNETQQAKAKRIALRTAPGGE
jgi:hypothetical protein